MSLLQNKKAAYHTLGCKLNFAETSSLRDQLERQGVQTVQKGEKTVSHANTLEPLSL